MDFRIEHQVGDDFIYINGADTIEYIAYPFPEGYIKNNSGDNVTAIVIGKSLNKSKKVRTRALAVLQIKEFGEAKNILVLVPTDDQKVLKGLNNFSDLIVKFQGVKNIIEQWYLTRCGIGCSEYIAWEDEHYVQNFLK